MHLPRQYILTRFSSVTLATVVASRFSSSAYLMNSASFSAKYNENHSAEADRRCRSCLGCDSFANERGMLCSLQKDVMESLQNSLCRLGEEVLERPDRGNSCQISTTIGGNYDLKREL